MYNVNEGEKWYVLARVNPPTQAGFYEQPDGSKVYCEAIPKTITPILININKEYVESFLKNGGSYTVIEVSQKED